MNGLLAALGPVGWLWDLILERVYNDNLVMMLTFGWALFLAPILTVVCAVLVLRGASVRRPTATPPPALTTND